MHSRALISSKEANSGESFGYDKRGGAGGVKFIDWIEVNCLLCHSLCVEIKSGVPQVREANFNLKLKELK